MQEDDPLTTSVCFSQPLAAGNTRDTPQQCCIPHLAGSCAALSPVMAGGSSTAVGAGSSLKASDSRPTVLLLLLLLPALLSPAPTTTLCTTAGSFPAVAKLRERPPIIIICLGPSGTEIQLPSRDITCPAGTHQHQHQQTHPAAGEHTL
jgi:hypothetical protein